VWSVQELADVQPLATWVWLTATALVLAASSVGHLNRSLLLSLLSLAAVSQRLCAVVEQLTLCCGRAWQEALVQAVLGKIELVIVSSVALQRGQLDLASLALMGSILFSMLTVAGVSLALAASVSTELGFASESLPASLGVAILAAGAALFPAFLTLPTCKPALHRKRHAACDESDKVIPLSNWVSAVLLTVYCAWLWSCGTSHKDGAVAVPAPGQRLLARRRAAVLMMWVLFLAAAATSVSGAVVTAMTRDLRWWQSRPLVAAVLIPAAVNCGDLTSAAEHAMHGRTEAAVRVAVGSAVQVMLCLLPSAVLGAAMHGMPLTFFTPDVQHATTVLLVTLTTARALAGRRASSVKGATLIGTHAMLAAAFWVEGRTTSSVKA
jgi:calcium/proton exchanger cax